MKVRSIRWRHGASQADVVALEAESRPGNSPVGQFEALVAECAAVLNAMDLCLEHVVHQRVWTRDRAVREATNDVRVRIFSDVRRPASSSFLSQARLRDGDIMLELLAHRPGHAGERRLVDFTPPRRYAWYLIQNGWMHMSGMAEEGETLEAQFVAAFAQVEAALARESRTWAQVMSATLFLERGYGEAGWLRDRFLQAIPKPLPIVTCEVVDGLASVGKHLEIEIVAAPA